MGQNKRTKEIRKIKFEIGESHKMKPRKKNNMIQSLQTGFSIIELISSKDRPLRLVEIQKETGITMSNLHKYLNTLTHLGILQRDKETNMYQLGYKLIHYGMRAIGHNDLLEQITPFLKEISAHTFCTVTFSVWTQNGPVIAKIWNSNHSLNIGVQLGSIMPPYSSIGKTFTVFLDKEQIKEWLEQDWDVQFQLEEEEFESIKQHKIAFAQEPLVPSVSSASIPIFGFKEDLLGVITVVGFTDTVPHNHTSEISQQLMNYQKEISRKFGFH